ncbi:hypothetical protein [Thermotoga sp.]|uniref:hypothetical protein n=1 Tax=Thermotoga sp. TaxID=28240 RepID=UPI0025F44A4F|nr:hypothetical protein [Thermotoga sp.]MCD6552080.1 hypothetical protein [Thermotoga sp.]
MPYVYRCKKCGAIYYSATSIEYHLNKTCEKCGGELEQLGEEGELMKKEKEKEEKEKKKK